MLRPVEIAEGGFAGIISQKVAADSIEEMDAITSGLTADRARAMAPLRKDDDAERQTATIVRSSWNLVFEVPGQAAIPGDSADHLVALRQETLPGAVEYHVVPMLSESAFLVARTKAPASHPLLAGRVRVFAGASYLGSAELAETAPGGDLMLPFGVDNRIPVKRSRLPQEHGDAGLTGRDRRIAFGYRTTIENLLGREVTVILEERVPVSEDDRIEVLTAKTTTPGGSLVDGRPGILAWSLKLEPGTRKEIALDYTVRYPGDIVIAGLQQGLEPAP